MKPRRFRRPAAPYRLIKRKQSRFIAVRIGRRQRSRRMEDEQGARAFAYRWISSDYPRLAAELGIATTPCLQGLNS